MTKWYNKDDVVGGIRLGTVMGFTIPQMISAFKDDLVEYWPPRRKLQTEQDYWQEYNGLVVRILRSEFLPIHYGPYHDQELIDDLQKPSGPTISL